VAKPTPDVVIIGAGPAGLTAAYELAKQQQDVCVLEADPRHVGGLSRTVEYKGFQFDIGGHRFFSKSAQVEDLWTEILPHDLLVRQRSSRIYYRGRFFSYPLKLGEALQKLGLLEASACVLSYARARLAPAKRPQNFEEWVCRRFGTRLYEAFFKTYTEKVWGMRCTEISADWAAQRIKGLSLRSALLSAVRTNGSSRAPSGIKTLATSFRYPRRGPGMMWNACAERVRALGGRVQLGRRVVDCAYDAATRLWTVTHDDMLGDREVEQARHLISSAPLRQLAAALTPALSADALAAAGGLKYRDFLTVALVLRDRRIFQDQWIYVHDPAVRVARIQNFKAWSPEMIPDPALCCYGLEYFCFAGDGLWNMSDDALVELARRELCAIGLARREDVLDGCVIRQPKAYPVYDDGYADRVRRVRLEMEARFPTLHVVGRNGMHRYNNQDHAMMTALLAAANVMAGQRLFDVWRVNEDAEYLESDSAAGSGAGGLRLVPARVALPADPSGASPPPSCLQ
jgi:protoporphyrinogen oxidase